MVKHPMIFYDIYLLKKAILGKKNVFFLTALTALFWIVYV
ncbi:hypothetical protein LLT7_07610 [Lactococcus cremoris subsp. cremoris TIFN7]|nr:hypothetical protein LLT7_07610 [Lactococcus cremoris subsp. cremoris TIFN7]